MEEELHDSFPRHFVILGELPTIEWSLSKVKRRKLHLDRAIREALKKGNLKEKVTLVKRRAEISYYLKGRK